MVLKQDGVHFVLCPKQGNKIEGVALNRICILGFFFCPKQAQGSKPYPNIGQYSHPPSLPGNVDPSFPGPALADGGFPARVPAFITFSEIWRRWKVAGKLLTLLAFARVLGIYFPTVSAWY